MERKRCVSCMCDIDSPVCPHCGYPSRNPNAPHQLPVGTVLRGQYQVGKVLGQGGFGITYLGWDLNLDIPIAIKEYYPNSFVTRDCTQTLEVISNGGNFDEVFRNNRERFLREARTLAKLRDIREIVQIYNFFQENNTAYIIMEFVQGVTLKDYIQSRGGRISTEESLSLLRPVMAALSQVHAAGLVHRDISPDNIMLTPDGSAKLLDFGAVRDVGNADVNKLMTKSTEAILKHGFAPMEQYQTHGTLGPWTDVYAMCATVYYCLTGRIPADAPARVLGEGEVSFSGIPGLSPQQAALLEQGMETAPKNRVSSIQALYEGLFGESLSTSTRQVSHMTGGSSIPEPQRAVPAYREGTVSLDPRGAEAHTAYISDPGPKMVTAPIASPGPQEPVTVPVAHPGPEMVTTPLASPGPAGANAGASDGKAKKKSPAAFLAIAAVAVVALVCLLFFGKQDSSTPAGTEPAPQIATEAPAAAPATGSSEAATDSSDDGVIQLTISTPYEESLYTELLEQFVQLYPDVEFQLTVHTVDDLYAGDAQNGDLFVFESAYLADFVAQDKILLISEEYSEFLDNMGVSLEEVISDNLEASINACSLGDALYGFPMEGISTYFLYYDASVISPAQTATWDTLLAAAQQAGKKVAFPMENAWYSASFFLGADSPFGTIEDGSFLMGWSFSLNSRLHCTEIVESMINIAAHPAYARISQSAYYDALSSGDLCAFVSGTWDATTASNSFGSYAATTLPSYTCINDYGETVQAPMYSFSNFRCFGVNPQSQNTQWAVLLAQFLTSQDAQTHYCGITGNSATNLNVQQTWNDPAAAAQAAQLQYSIPQDVPATFWNPMNTLSKLIHEGTLTSTSDENFWGYFNEVWWSSIYIDPDSTSNTVRHRFGEYDISDLVKGSDGLYYTPAGGKTYIAIDYPVAYMSDATLVEYIQAWNYTYDETCFQALMNLADDMGLVPLSDESYSLFIRFGESLDGPWELLTEDEYRYFIIYEVD